MDLYDLAFVSTHIRSIEAVDWIATDGTLPGALATIVADEAARSAHGRLCGR
jgi:hypothetical protein